MPKLLKNKQETVVREVLHEKISSKVCLGPTALTVAQAIKLLGCREAGEDEEPIFSMPDGKKMICDNNTTNRPFVLSNSLTLKQEILRGKWEYNGEPIIIGKTGLVLNGQHRLIGLILADADYQEAPEEYPELESSPTLDTSVTFGVSEEDNVVNTIDTGKTRTLTDVLYRSSFFSGEKSKDRKAMSSIADSAVKVLWRRTAAGATDDIRQTHSEALDFIERHPSIIDAVRHIYEENGEKNQIGKYLRPGQAAALLYLMICCESDGEKYHSAETPSEKLLDLSMKSKAQDFWVKLAGGSKEFANLREAFAEMIRENCDSVEERQAVIIKAWGKYCADESITPKSIELSYTEEEGEEGETIKFLNESPLVGGIDLGNKPELDEEDIELEVEQPKPEKAEKKGAKKAKKTEATLPEVGEACVWNDKSGNECKGKLLEVKGDKASVQIFPGFKGAGQKRSLPFSSLKAV